MNTDFFAPGAGGPDGRSQPPASPDILSDGTIPLLSVDDVQRYLHRSRASVYRYANTDPGLLNPPYDPQKLNPEIRRDKDAPLKFHPHEVRRFAEEVLGLNPTIQVQPPEETVTQDLMRQILHELKAIHQLLQAQQQQP